MMDNKTLHYYNECAETFANSTINVEFTDIQDRFLKYLKTGARILDFGCGAGRDTKYFISKGFQVEAVDGSEELVKLASEFTGIEVKQMLFQDLNTENTYDGIWACASILHLTHEELTGVFSKMENALVSQGILYVSFKYGNEEQVRNGRHFTDMTEDKINGISGFNDLFIIEDMWKSADVRPDREQEEWLNIILRKKN